MRLPAMPRALHMLALVALLVGVGAAKEVIISATSMTLHESNTDASNSTSTYTVVLDEAPAGNVWYAGSFSGHSTPLFTVPLLFVGCL
jgi:hypothetical protein